MLRREGSHFVAYMDFCESVTNYDLNAEHCLQKLMTPAVPSALSFSGWVGFFSYDFLATFQGLKLYSSQDYRIPHVYFRRSHTIVRIYEDKAVVESVCEKNINAFLTTAKGEKVSAKNKPKLADISCNLNFNTYRKLFFAAREEIMAGNTYQIKLSQRYRIFGGMETVETFRKLYAMNPSPEAFMIRGEDFAMVSCSPETVIDKRGAFIETRPIGGTWERHKNVDTNDQVAAFTADGKETSEHNMLVDLERNDLSRICKTGSVHVLKYREVEPYAHLLHLVSTIRGELRTGVAFADIMRAMLPGGSITGCPKWRTMEIIDRLEPCFRGPYTGSFGTIADNGDLHFNLIIRTLVESDGCVYAQSGGGIVVDSTPEYEYRENGLKARALLEVLA